MATMEDAVSRESIESSSTGDEFVVVNGEPKLKFTGDFNDICDAMMSDGNAGDSRLSTSPISQSDSKDLSHVIPSSQSVGFLSEDFASPDNIGDTGDEQPGPGEKVHRFLDKVEEGEVHSQLMSYKYWFFMVFGLVQSYIFL